MSQHPTTSEPRAKISVIMPCFNHGEFLRQAVTSVMNIGRDDVELIVVDDGSTDERTRQELDSLAAEGVTVIRQENAGLSAARNAGLAASHGECIFPLDSDDRMRPGWLDQGIRILDSDPKIGVVYGDAQCFGVRSDCWSSHPFSRDRLLRWNFIHASALYRRAVWEQNGGYDVKMTHGMEDWDFWLGALEHGWQFAYIKKPLFDYRIAKVSMTNLIHGSEQQIKDYVAAKHASLYRQAWLHHQESLTWAFGNFARVLGYWVRVACRTKIWYPVLNATRPVRNALGLRKRDARRPAKA